MTCPMNYVGIQSNDHQDLENMLMDVNFPNLLAPDPDDDEAMVEYAIALSLQQQEQQDQQAQGRTPRVSSLFNSLKQSFTQALFIFVTYFNYFESRSRVLNALKQFRRIKKKLKNRVDSI